MTITLVERLDPRFAHESTDGWNKRGELAMLGYCEAELHFLEYRMRAANYSPSIGIAISIASSRWTLRSFLGPYLGGKKNPPGAPSFYAKSTPHQKLRLGDKDADFLRRRHALLSAHHLFARHCVQRVCAASKRLGCRWSCNQRRRLSESSPPLGSDLVPT